MMNIGEAASASGVSAKMIRHYEELALLPTARRTESGYRQYEQSDVHTLRFIRHSRDLGFSLTEIAELVGLWQNRRRPSRLVKALAETHIKELEQKAAELLAMKSALEHLVHCCHAETVGPSARSWRVWRTRTPWRLGHPRAGAEQLRARDASRDEPPRNSNASKDTCAALQAQTHWPIIDAREVPPHLDPGPADRPAPRSGCGCCGHAVSGRGVDDGLGRDCWS